MGMVEDAATDVFGPDIVVRAPPAEIPSHLIESITRATASLEADDHIVVVGGVNEKGAQGAVIVRGAKGWDIYGVVGQDWGAPRPTFEVGVLKRWKKKD